MTRNVVVEKGGKGIMVSAKADSIGKIELPPSAEVVIRAGNGSTIEVIDNPQMPCESVMIFAAKNSHIIFSSAGAKVSARTAEIESNASLDWIDTIVGNAKIHITSRLNGAGSRTSITSAFFGSESELEINAEAIHNSPKTTSSITIRGALTRNSKAVIMPKTIITGKAADSEGKQKASILLLGEGGKATAVPRLEMNNKDIKASHSVSIGQLDQEKLFYLMSRGLDAAEAMKIAVGGFFEPLLKEMGLPGENARLAIYEALEK